MEKYGVIRASLDWYYLQFLINPSTGSYTFMSCYVLAPNTKEIF